MARLKTWTMMASAGTLLFPADTRVLDPATGSYGENSPFGALSSSVREQLARVPDVSPGKARSTASAVPPVDAEELEVVEGELRRPNGELYVPRMVRAGDSAIQDVATVRKLYEKGIPLLLVGPPGTGKTALAEAALPDVITFLGTGDTERADFVGGYVQNPDGTFTWVDGPLLVAMERGLPFFIDEVALIDPRVAAVAYAPMDGRGELAVTDNPARGVVKAARGFYVFGACNPDAPGAVMSEALTSRFRMQIEVLTDFDLATKLGVPREIVVVAKNLDRKHKESFVQQPPQLRELLAFKEIAETFGIDVALSNFIGKAEVGDRDAYVEAVKSAFGREVEGLNIR